MYGSVSRGDYEALLYDWNNNLNEGVTVEKNPEYKVIYAVADYYQTAMRYRVFEEKGYVEEANKAYDTMQNARESMGDASYMADDIDKMFGLN